MAEHITQQLIFSRFIFPFFLVFTIVFAILEKTKLFGDGKKTINAIVAFVTGLIFVSVAYPVEIVSNLILFLTVALITMFVGLLIWGFVVGEEKIESKAFKGIFGGVLVIAVIIALLWATGAYDNIINWLFHQDWSNSFWTNLLFVVAIAIAMSLILKSSAGGSGGGK